MHEEDFQPEGYKPFLNMVAHHTSYNLLTTSIRAPKKQVTDQAVYDQIKKATSYAHQFGIGIVMDLDVRLARAAFHEKYPDEMQEMLRVREQPLSNNGKTTLTIASAAKLHDHYTSYTTPYLPLEGRFVKAYSYVRDTEGIVAQSIQELDQDSYLVTEAGPKQVTISFTLDIGGKNKYVCAIVSFTHLSPDVFAPHLLSFQQEIIEKYADSGIVGVCKDEWGFPPCHDGNPDKNDHWYSKWFAKAYAQQTGGRDLQQDVFLMTFPIKGKEEERQAVINQYMRLCWKRNAAIECDCYNAVKTILGPQGVMATHPTWWPYPGIREIKKNGLHWWAAQRDWAQVDEVTPFCIRTALAKKWGSPIWYNMYYSSKLTDYETSIWTHALGGGRVNFHPLFPTPEPPGWSQAILFRNQLMHGNCRIRLLNFITKSAVDCPVAVIFGHANATNWAGPGFNDVGMNVASSLWAEGYYVDLIPTSEISSGSLRIDSQGWLCYGAQRYVAAVLYHPEFEGPETASFFQKAANGSTELLGVGQWTKDFDGKPRDASWRLPESMKIATNANACVAEVIKFLQKKGTIRQEPAVCKIGWGGEITAAPPTKGHIRLLDGTHVFVAGEKDVAGDPIRGNFFIDGHNITIDAIGVAAWRLDNRGKLSALAAGGLKDFRIDSFEIHLEQRVDLAFWQDEQGQMHGVLAKCKRPHSQCVTKTDR